METAFTDQEWMIHGRNRSFWLTTQAW
jgi:hypothetical protein